jgi:hypothetical protein
MSKETKDPVLIRWRWRYATAGAGHKTKLLDQAVELLGYHRKAAIRALGQPKPKSVWPRPSGVLGRPKTYHPETRLPILKPIGFSAFQASARTLDRLIGPLRVGLARRGGTRPGSLLRQSIPIRGPWTEEGPGWLELDTVALCGGCLDDRHLWMLEAVDIRTDWTELRALPNRGQRCTLAQIAPLEQSLPFTLLGLDRDNGGEFINHPLVAYLGQRPQPVLFTRGQPYRKNDNARVEQRNWTHVRQHFGYERYDNPQVTPLINTLCQGALGQLLNHFLPTHLLQAKRRKGNRTVCLYGPALTPYARVLAAPEVLPTKKAELRSRHGQLNPFALARDIERQKKLINSQRLLRA